jgi:CopG-like RHH_1 or ribbon-helix-helix domain, RHH_5
MRTLSKRTSPEATEAAFEKSNPDLIADGEVVAKLPNPTSPISFRLSAPLLERIDRLAVTEGRTRSNLIQHILWEHIRAKAD